MKGDRAPLLFILLVASFVLLGYTSYRAYRLSFTHDESHSFEIVLGNSPWQHTSADHRLNTRLMIWAYRLLGGREWQLRFPNVLAHVLYLVFGLSLLKKLRHPTSVLLGFAWLNLDPFLLDFFSLARGYGLATGLSMAALFFLWEAWTSRELRFVFPLSLISMTFASLAVLANYTWLNFHLPMLAANLFLLLLDRSEFKLKLNRATMTACFVLTGANTWFIYNVARRLWALRASNELGNRGQTGFLGDTIGSLIDTYFYNMPAYPYLQLRPSSMKPALTVILIGAFSVAVIVLAYRIFAERQLLFSAVLLLVLTLAVAVPITEHYFLALDYPTERIALYYVPLAAASGTFFIDEYLSWTRRRIRALCHGGAIVLSGVMLLHFFQTANLESTLTWFYDAHTKSAMVDIGRYFRGPSSQRITISNDWVFEPSINYYRKTLPYKWLNPANRNEAFLSRDNDVIYCYVQDLQNFQFTYTVLERYENPDTVLLRVDR
jgi:hypothetical protein